MSIENMDANDSGESSAPVNDGEGSQVVQETGNAGKTEGTQQQTDNTPFHEHPRFKELIESRSQLQSRVDELTNSRSGLESELQQMRQMLEAFQQKQAGPSKPEQFISRLEGIDKDLADFVKQGYASQSEIAELKAQLDERIQSDRAREAAQYRDGVMKQISALHAEHKVDKDLHSYYQSEVMRIASENPNLRVNDLPNVYKQVHDTMSKYLDSRDRVKTKEYVVDKTKDGSVPASAKGGNPVGSKKADGKAPDGVNARDYMRAQIVKNALRQHRGESDL